MLLVVILLILSSAFIQKNQIDIEGKWKLSFNANCVDNADSIWLEKYKSFKDTVSLIEFQTSGFMEVYSKYSEESIGNSTSIYAANYNQCSTYNLKSFYLNKNNDIIFHWANQPEILTKNEIDSLSKSQLVEHFNDKLWHIWFYYEIKEIGDKLLLVRKQPNCRR